MKYAIVQVVRYDPMEFGGIAIAGTANNVFEIVKYCDTIEQAKGNLTVHNQNPFGDYVIIQVWQNDAD